MGIIRSFNATRPGALTAVRPRAPVRHHPLDSNDELFWDFSENSTTIVNQGSQGTGANLTVNGTYDLQRDNGAFKGVGLTAVNTSYAVAADGFQPSNLEYIAWMCWVKLLSAPTSSVRWIMCQGITTSTWVSPYVSCGLRISASNNLETCMVRSSDSTTLHTLTLVEADRFPIGVWTHIGGSVDKAGAKQWGYCNGCRSEMNFIPSEPVLLSAAGAWRFGNGYGSVEGQDMCIAKARVRVGTTKLSDQWWHEEYMMGFGNYDRSFGSQRP